ncbi:hypothetical protein pdam_00023567 [Pocillopora damicornis]|uniref:Uncharacterized protein n=1 Tax=Pocillopora damicornis TaxID=46731 RepID=A0A3M6V600_POCDA|nr:hypothetical protein pdam_00023567 [Pocillopora damicornis]
MPKEALQRFERAKHAADDRCDGCEALLGQKTENTLVRDTLYQIQFTTSPNEGFYEVSVRMKQGVPELTAEISRIDAYKNQADCISNNFPLLRKYCYCSTISSSRWFHYRSIISKYAYGLLPPTQTLAKGIDET